MLHVTEKSSLSAKKELTRQQFKDIAKQQYRDLVKSFTVLVVWLCFAILFLSTYSYAAEAPKGFSINTLDGQEFSLSSYQHKKPVFLFFWATWCPICKKEIPRIKALHKEFGDQIEVLAINVGYNDSLENIRQYQRTYNTNFPIAYDEHSHLSESFGVFGTPTQIVIDIDGKLRYQGNEFPEGLENALQMLSTSTSSNDEDD